MTPEKEKDMDNSNDNVRFEERDQDLVVLGAVSVETRGLPGAGEIVGRPFVPGMAED